MNKIKFALGAIALFIAVGSAVATAQSFTQQLAYYVSPAGLCEEIEINFECPVGEAGCEEFVEGASRQLYNSDTPTSTELPCSQPLDEPAN